MKAWLATEMPSGLSKKDMLFIPLKDQDEDYLAINFRHDEIQMELTKGLLNLIRDPIEEIKVPNELAEEVKTVFNKGKKRLTQAIEQTLFKLVKDIKEKPNEVCIKTLDRFVTYLNKTLVGQDGIIMITDKLTENIKPKYLGTFIKAEMDGENILIHFNKNSVLYHNHSAMFSIINRGNTHYKELFIGGNTLSQIFINMESVPA